jgi:hypothetical protein
MVVLPLGAMVKRATPVEEATTKGLMSPAAPWMLKVTVEEVAFTPATVPLSLRVPEALIESRSVPVRLMLAAVRLEADAVVRVV